MVKAEELRIGNMVQIGKAETMFITVETIGKEGINRKEEYDEDMISEGAEHSPYVDEYKYEDLQPVELTPAILEKAGFEYSQRRGTFTNNKMQLVQDGNNVFLPLKHTLQEIKSIDFQYVHTLQNLYHSLTGQELTINLNQMQAFQK